MDFLTGREYKSFHQVLGIGLSLPLYKDSKVNLEPVEEELFVFSSFSTKRWR